MLKRIYVLIIAVLVIAILTTGLVSIKVVSTYNDQNNRDYLLSAARLIQREMKGGRTAAEASGFTRQVFNEIEETFRVTVVNRQGVVLYDSEANQSQMENHLFRPEISYAFQHRSVGSAVRESSTLKEQMLYIALYDAEHDAVIRTAMSLQAYNAGLNNILLTILLVMGCALVLLALIGTFATRWITRPLVDLEKAAQAMSKGQYAVRVRHLKSRDGELSALSDSFNNMADRLQTVVGDLEDKNARLDVIFNAMTDPLLVVAPNTEVTYLNKSARSTFGRNLDPAKSAYPLFLITHSQDVDQLVMQALDAGQPVDLETPIRTATGETIYHVIASPTHSTVSRGVILTFHDISESRKLQKMRSDFVANVTHELRTPLTSIRGFIDTLRSGAVHNPEVAMRFLDIIDIEAERLHKLISDILILSEIEDLHEDRERETFDLPALIDEVAVLLDDEATARKISIIIENAEQPLPVFANRHRIKQVLINLADNAIKYNLDGGKVYIRADRLENGPVRLTVRDTGVGIPFEHQERIFERFYRVDTSHSRELGGTGLGLSIVKHIAQLYNGTATVISQPGAGSTFQVDLAI